MGPDSRAQLPSRRARVLTAVGTGAVFGGALLYIGRSDPHRPGSLFPPCPFYALTGWYCPGCGGLRMTHDLLHGDVAAAVVDNVFVLVGLPLLALWVLVRRHRGQRVWSAVSVAVLVIAIVGWTVVRNLPGFPLVPTLLDG
ncbi:MAG: hypothetical protein K0R68_2884 [Mycobacterium sp.]|jgi:hypothetical protein|nr:hypothetical protein [Mycobacterium sp.]